MDSTRQRWGKRLFACLLVLTMIAQFVPAPKRAGAAVPSPDALANWLAAATADQTAPQAKPEPSDISAHWAKPAIQRWLQEGLITGFTDGSFRPDADINRAELAAIVNRAYGFTKPSAGSFADVPAAKWYAADAARAKEAGYMQGDAKGLFRPEASVTREEAAVILARLLKLDVKAKESEAAKFADAKEIASWSRGAVGAVAAAGVMQGYDGNRFKPGKALTRAETVVLLDRARAPVAASVPSSIDKAGTYGPAAGKATIEGNVAINAPNVILRNVTIKGDLVLGEGIGEGDATLDGVVVEGTTTVNGGGKNSVHVLDSKLTRVFVTKVDGQVRVVIEGSTAVDQVTVESGGTLQVASGSSASYGTVTVSTTGEVTLDGDFPNVVLVEAAQLTVTSGKVDNLTLTDKAAGAGVTLNANVQVGVVNADAAATIKGEGKIGTASVTAAGVTIAQKPSQTIVASGISADVGGTKVEGTGTSTGSGPSTGPTVTTVSVAVSNPTAAGFDLKLSPSVPNLTISNVVLVNQDGMPGLLSKIRSTDEGENYRADGFLTGGATYSLNLVMPGYTFGGSKSIAIPDLPAITGAMLDPAGTKLVLLLSKTMAGLPASPAGFSLTDSGAPVAITGAALSDPASRIVLTLGAPVNPNTLELTYAPGTVKSTDGKALPALTFSDFTNGGTPAGRVAYDRMLGMTAVQAATDLKDNVGVAADVAAKALIDGGYNTNGLVKALNTVYGISNENMPRMLLPNGISVYHLLIGMKEAGILNVENLGKNFSYLDGESDDWVRALHQAGYTDEQVTRYSWFFPNLKVAESLRKYYDTTSGRAAKILHKYSSYPEDVGRAIYEVYGIGDKQAASEMKAAGVNKTDAADTLKMIYQIDPGRATVAMKEAGYEAQDLAYMLQFTYEQEPKQIVLNLREAGVTLQQMWTSLGYVQNPAVAVREGGFSAQDLYLYMRATNGTTYTSVSVGFLILGGYSALETAGALKARGDVRTRSELMFWLRMSDVRYMDVAGYDFGEAANAVRQTFGGSISENAAVLAEFGAPTVKTMTPGQITIADALGRAGFNVNEIVQYLAPSSTLTLDQASTVILELRNMGFQLSGLRSIVNNLAYKVYGNSSNASLVKLLFASDSTAITRDKAKDIATFLLGSGLANIYSLATDLQASFTKVETVQAIKDASGTTMADMIRLLNDTRLYQGSLPDMLFVGQVIKDVYGATSDEAIRAIRGSYISSLYDIYAVREILKQVYGHTDTSNWIHDLSAGGYTTYQIADGLSIPPQIFKSAGYNSTEVARLMMYKGTQLGQVAMGLKNMGYSLTEVARALRNLFGGGSSDAIVRQVTELLTAQGNNFPPADINAAITEVFGVDTFAILAKGMHDNNTATATQAAAILRNSLVVEDPVVMARGLAAAGYLREDVLVAIFQSYCNGYIYSEGAVAKMDAVIAAVYPEVTERLDATLKASDVRTPKHAISVLKTLGVSVNDTIGILVRVYNLNAVDTLDSILQYRTTAYDKDAINAVGAYFGQSGIELYVKMLQSNRNTDASSVVIHLQQSFDIDDGMQLARLLIQAGYSQTSVLYAIGHDFMTDSADQFAQVLVQLYGNNDLPKVVLELDKLNFTPLQVYLAIARALPNKSQGEIIVAMNQRFYYSELVDLMRYSEFGRGDATVIVQLKNIGMRANDAKYLIRDKWEYGWADTVRYMNDMGYPLADIGRAVSSGAENVQIYKAMRSIGLPLEKAAVIGYAMDESRYNMISNLYEAGWRDLGEAVEALKATKEDPKYYVEDLWSVKPTDSWTLARIASAVSEHSQLTLVELGYSMRIAKTTGGSRWFTDWQVYNALKEVADIGVSFINDELDTAISLMLTDLKEGIPFAIMREAGWESNDLAVIMKRLGWSWIPACIQLVQAGYDAGDTWDALWDVYHNELGFQILNIMSAVAPLASLGLADNLTIFQTALRAAMNKAMMYYFTSN